MKISIAIHGQLSPGDPTVFEALKASHLRETFHLFADALRDRRKTIDRLNVYPVPDGDTGTNLSLTAQSVVRELKEALKDDMHTVAGAVSKGAILGARGNSGAILAQALRALAESVKDKSSIGPEEVAVALEKARAAAYQSVLKPVEGTMLTVLSAAAVAARKSADLGHELREQMDNVRQASADALARTPELLPVLKSAGVVDAGGSGFLLFIDALRYVVTGHPIPGAVDSDTDSADSPDIQAAHSEISELRWEVMYLLDAADNDIQGFKEAWSTMGDSIVVVGGDGLWNCHIHTDEVDPTVEAGKAIGRPYEIRITDLQEQAGQAHGEAWSGDASVELTTAVVAVVNGDGLLALYRDSGATGFVTGGQSMNPSVEELLKAVEAVPSQNVILLPNNKNIRAAADQVDGLTEKHVAVVPTVSVVAGMAVLVSFDNSVALEVNVEAMVAANEAIVCGEVTQSVRDTESPAGPIKEGDWLGLTAGDGIAVVAATVSDALVQLVEFMVGDDHEILTVIEGDGATADATSALQSFVTEKRPNVELEVHQGGQALYPYYVGVE